MQKHRIDLGLTWKAVAIEVGADSTTVANWIKGRSQPDLTKLPAVIRFLGYDPRRNPGTPGAALKRCRQAQGVSQKEMAARLWVDPSTLKRWERDERTPTGEYLKRVQFALER